MKVAILETVKAQAGFELEFDRIIIEALQDAGHEAVMLLPEGTVLDQDFNVPKYFLNGGEIISYDGVKGIKRIWYSFLRENRRVKWFDSAVDKAKQEGIGAIILTTATYRYLRSLKKSRLRNSEIPVYFVFLGVNPQEMPKFMSHARDCLSYKNIHLCVTTLRDDFGDKKPQNVRLIKPPVMIPRNCKHRIESDTLRIGFFGHYRKGEKNIEWLMRSVTEAKFKRSIRFVIQLAPTKESDCREIEHIMEAYQYNNRVEFITQKLMHDDWYNAVLNVDVVYLPYTAKRYLYNWSAIYFTAIGAGKPVITTKNLNPEVLNNYKIGECIDMDDFSTFKMQLEDFVNDYENKNIEYKRELDRANRAYSKMSFIKNFING